MSMRFFTTTTVSSSLQLFSIPDFSIPNPRSLSPIMELKIYRASTMSEALALVRRELGPDAAVLHTREVQQRRLFGLFSGRRMIEVTASRGVNVPSRLKAKDHAEMASAKISASPTYARTVACPHRRQFLIHPGTVGPFARRARTNRQLADDGQGTLPAQRNQQGRRIAGRTF